jgi:hypothetical protein
VLLELDHPSSLVFPFIVCIFFNWIKSRQVLECFGQKKKPLDSLEVRLYFQREDSINKRSAGRP